MHRRPDAIADATYSGPTHARATYTGSSYPRAAYAGAGDNGCTGDHRRAGTGQHDDCANGDDRGPRNHHGCPLREPALAGVELF